MFGFTMTHCLSESENFVKQCSLMQVLPSLSLHNCSKWHDSFQLAKVNHIIDNSGAPFPPQTTAVDGVSDATCDKTLDS